MEFSVLTSLLLSQGSFSIIFSKYPLSISRVREIDLRMYNLNEAFPALNLYTLYSIYTNTVRQLTI